MPPFPYDPDNDNGSRSGSGLAFSVRRFFGVRLVLQWIATERQKRSVFPMSFWLFSVAGGLTLLSYAVYRLDPVFIIAEGIGLLICPTISTLSANQHVRHAPMR